MSFKIDKKKTMSNQSLVIVINFFLSEQLLYLKGKRKFNTNKNKYKRNEIHNIICSY